MLHSNPSIRYKHSAAALLLSFILAFGAYIAFVFAANSLVSTQDMLERSSRVVRELRDVRDDVLDMETGQRGFLLTGAEPYLDSFYLGQAALRQDLIELRNELNAYAPSDSDIGERLAALAAAKEREILLTIDLVRAGETKAAMEIVRAGEGKRQMDRIRALVDLYTDKYRDQRVAPREEVRASLALARSLLAFGGIALVMLVGVAFWNFRAGAACLQQSADRLALEAMHDALTDLPNRRYLEQWLGHALAHSKRSGEPVAALYLDLDGFAAVNNTLGHDAGDEMLKQVGRKLRAALRDSDFIARQGGDEFVVIVCGLSAGKLVYMARKLVDTLSTYTGTIGLSVAGGVSIGIAVAEPEDDHTVDSLLAQADAAMYEAKRGGKNQFSFYGPPSRINSSDVPQFAKLASHDKGRRIDPHHQTA